MSNNLYFKGFQSNCHTAQRATCTALQADAERHEAPGNSAEAGSTERAGAGGAAAGGLVGRSRFVQLPRLVKSAGRQLAH